MRRRWLLLAVAGVVVVLAAGAVVVWRAVRPPEISSFYDTPSNASAAKPGQLLPSGIPRSATSTS